MFPRNEGNTYQSPFRSPSSNVLKTKGLFYEFYGHNDTLYTLKDQDVRMISRDEVTGEVTNDKVYPSLYRLYMEANDLTEYEFAQANLESYDHWIRLCEAGWFKREYLPRWRRDLELKQKATALKNIVKEASSGSKNSFQANKFLFEKNIGPGASKAKSKTTTISTAEVLDQIKQMESMTEDDYERILGEQATSTAQ